MLSDQRSCPIAAQDDGKIEKTDDVQQKSPIQKNHGHVGSIAVLQKYNKSHLMDRISRLQFKIAGSSLGSQGMLGSNTLLANPHGQIVRQHCSDTICLFMLSPQMHVRQVAVNWRGHIIDNSTTHYDIASTKNVWQQAQGKVEDRDRFDEHCKEKP